MYLPVAIVVVTIVNHGEIEHNRHDRSDDVDHQASEDHQSRRPVATTPYLASSAGFPVANVLHCEFWARTRMEVSECWIVRFRKMTAYAFTYGLKELSWWNKERDVVLH